MKNFYNEYGKIILSAIVVTLLVALASPVGASVKDSVTGLITKFASTSGSLANTLKNIEFAGAENDKPVEVTMYAVPEAKLPAGSVQGNGATLDGSSPASFYSLEPMSELQEVRIDGAVVDPVNYTVTSGSTIITLHDDFIASLEDGEHTIDIVSKNTTAKGSFITRNSGKNNQTSEIYRFDSPIGIVNIDCENTTVEIYEDESLMIRGAHDNYNYYFDREEYEGLIQVMHVLADHERFRTLSDVLDCTSHYIIDDGDVSDSYYFISGIEEDEIDNYEYITSMAEIIYEMSGERITEGEISLTIPLDVLALENIDDILFVQFDLAQSIYNELSGYAFLAHFIKPENIAVDGTTYIHFPCSGPFFIIKKIN